jgi:hypothetical protein
MAKPTEIMQWATDVGATSDPGGTRRATGFVSGKKAPAKWFNFLHGAAGKWHAYLDNLHGETEFLNKAYTWTAAHVFGSDVTVGGNVLLASGSAVAYSPTKPTRTSFAELHKAVAAGSAPGDLLFTDDGWAQISAVGATSLIRVPFRLPPGAVLTQVRAQVFHGGAYNCTMSVYRKACNIGGTNLRFNLGLPVTITSASGTQTIPRAGLSDTAGTFVEYWVEFEFSNVSSHVEAVEITWTDPGPRTVVT